MVIDLFSSLPSIAQILLFLLGAFILGYWCHWFFSQKKVWEKFQILEKRDNDLANEDRSLRDSLENLKKSFGERLEKQSKAFDSKFTEVKSEMNKNTSTWNKNWEETKVDYKTQIASSLKPLTSTQTQLTNDLKEKEISIGQLKTQITKTDDFAKKSKTDVVAQIEALNFEPYALKTALTKFAEKSELNKFALSSDLGEFAKVSALSAFMTTDKEAQFLVKEDLQPYNNKQEVSELIQTEKELIMEQIPKTPDYTSQFNSIENSLNELKETKANKTTDFNDFAKKEDLSQFVNTKDWKSFKEEQTNENASFAKRNDLESLQEKSEFQSLWASEKSAILSQIPAIKSYDSEIHEMNSLLSHLKESKADKSNEKPVDYTERFESLEARLNALNSENEALRAELEAIKSKPAPAPVVREVVKEVVKEVARDERGVPTAPIVDKLSIKEIKATASEKDDLKKIKGIGPFIEEKVNALGIYTFEQVAALTSDDADIITDAIQFFPGRIQRDDWMTQAKGFVSQFTQNLQTH